MQVRDDAEMVFFNVNNRFLYRPLKKTQTSNFLEQKWQCSLKDFPKK